MPDAIQNALQQLQPFGWVILILFILLFLVNTVFLLLFTGRIAWLKIPPEGRQNPLSVILPLRNEEANLRENLPRILSAGNAEYEVVAVDDFSHDSSLTLLGALKRQEPKLRFSSLSQETRHSEKLARNIAVKSARYDWIMLVSPSVTKTGSDWPGGIMSQMNSPVEVVVNYSNVKPEDTFFNLLFRLEFFFQQMKSFGFILNGLPYVVSEENVAFIKKNYFDGGGFRGKISESYAHLELVINAFMKKKTTRILLTSGTSVYRTEPVSGTHFFDLIKKEARLIQYLSFSRKFFLVISEWIKILFIPAAIFLLIVIPLFWPLVIGATILMALGYSFIIKIILNRLDEGKLFLPSLLFGIILPWFKLIFRAGYNYQRRKKRWKEKK
jgi:glycosyltransferase involved in cell wall biosynthesis